MGAKIRATPIQPDKPQLTLKKRIVRVVRRLILAVVAAAALLVAVYFAYMHRPQPPSIRRQIFEGVTYIREVRPMPHPLIIHTIEVDLTDPNVGFLVTPGDPNAPRPLRARKTSTFLKEFGVQVAVNGDYFFPFASRGPLNYYPHEGDSVELEGYAWSRGLQYSRGGERHLFPVLYISNDRRMTFEKPPWPIENAISGICMLVKDGAFAVPFPDKNKLEPCTAAVLSRDGKRFLIIVVEGRQPGYSEGVTLYQFAHLIMERGGWNAIDLDGGGSETLVMEGSDGKPQILNSIIDHRIPGWERPVANHLGIFARRLKRK
jgi:hypothetical protein